VESTDTERQLLESIKATTDILLDLTKRLMERVDRLEGVVIAENVTITDFTGQVLVTANTVSVEGDVDSIDAQDGSVTIEGCTGDITIEDSAGVTVEGDAENVTLEGHGDVTIEGDVDEVSGTSITIEGDVDEVNG
jgi:hypothetical protein